MGARVTHLTTAHARGEVRIFLKQCMTLRRAGYEVHLMVADGLGNDTVDGVDIHDVGKVQGRFQRMFVLPWRMYLVARRLNAMIYHYHEPELHFIALPLTLNGAKVIYDSHEDVPRAILSRDWIRPKLRKIISFAFEKFENFIAKRIASVVGATDHIAFRFSKLNNNAIAINNYPLEEEIDCMRFTEYSKSRVCYIGDISRVRGIIEIVNAINLIDTQLVLAGSFESPKLESEVRSMEGWSKVDYRGFVTREQVHNIMASSNAGLLFFQPEPNHIASQPNKMFEYMSAGIPVIASNFPLWRKIIEGKECGLCVDPIDPQAIAKAIETLAQDSDRARNLGQNGRRAVEECYNWGVESKKLLKFYEELLRNHA